MLEMLRELSRISLDSSPTRAPRKQSSARKLHNTTVHGAKAVAGVSPAGDVSRGALLFAALAALLALVM